MLEVEGFAGCRVWLLTGVERVTRLVEPPVPRKQLGGGRNRGRLSD